MALASDQGICLRKFEYSETSQILTLLTRAHGLVRVIAKGAHRRTKAGASKFDGGVDLLDQGAAVFTADASRELATLTEWKLCEGHMSLRRDLRTLHLGLYATELVSMLFEEHDPHPRVFVWLEQLLAELGTAQREEAFLAFELLVLEEAGFMPQLSACVACGRSGADDEPAHFSPARGGVLCRNCEAIHPDRISADPRVLRILRSVQSSARQQQRLPRLSRHQTDPLNHLLAEHAQHALGRRLRMPPYVLLEKRTAQAPAFSRKAMVSATLA